MLKVCSLCHTSLPLSEFYKRSIQNGRGLRAECKDCCRDRTRAWYQDERNRAKRVAYATKWNKANPGARRRIHLKRQYGITPEDYDRMHTAQHGRCGICLKEMKLVVDHDHATGRVRGLLCRPCNRSIGQLGEDADTLRRAAEWVTPI